MHPILFEYRPLKLFTYGFFLALAFFSAISSPAGRPGGWACRWRNSSTCVFTQSWGPWWAPACYTSSWISGLSWNIPLKLLPCGKGASISMEGYPGPGGGLLLYSPASVALAGYPGRPGPGRTRGSVFRPHRLLHGRLFYGTPSYLPWAVIFTNPQSLCPVKEPFHPAQLYEAPLALGVFGLLFLKTKKRYDGQMILTYFCLAGLVRFVVEFFRNPGDYRGPVLFGWMPLTQVIALGLALVCGALLLYFGRRAGRP